MIHVAIVITVIPVVLSAPLALVLVPPAVTSAPAPFPRLVQLVACPFRMAAMRPMVLNRLVQPVIRFCNPALAIAVIRP
jgi:hypothetical protein